MVKSMDMVNKQEAGNAVVKKITVPFTCQKAEELKCSDNVLISGVIYTARDAAHKRLIELLDEGKELPIDVKDGIMYYVGPAPAKPGPGYRLCRSYYQLQDGFVCAGIIGSGPSRHDR